MLEVSHVSKKYRGCQQALEDVSLSVGPGEIVGIFGPNGAGKTTLLKCILGLLRYGFGSVTLDGQPITPKNIARLSFATCEHSFFPGLTAAGHRDFCAEHFPAFRAGRFQMLMDFFRLPEKRALRGFSTGQKNQFEVILALCQGADYILMDEPFAGNDVFNREDFYRVLLGILEPTETILLSTICWRRCSTSSAGRCSPVGTDRRGRDHRRAGGAEPEPDGLCPVGLRL